MVQDVLLPEEKARIKIDKQLIKAGWDVVSRDDGIDYVMVRVGARGYGTGTITLDEYYADNLSRATQAGLDIGLINKYYDLAQAGDDLAKEHYLTLEKTAGDCAECGHCDGRCPFHVQQMRRMQEISRYFGK